MHRLILLSTTAMLVVGCGPTPADPPTTTEVTGFGDEIAKKLSIEPLDDSELGNEAVRRDVAILIAWLANTSEIEIHRINGADANVNFLSKDGHNEAVYDGASKLVTDLVNEGSYNYAHPVLDPLGHFTVDILPWIELGASRQDPTSKQTRLGAYLEDLRAGLHRATTGPIPVLGEDFNWRDLRRDVSVRLFRRALGKGGQRLSDVLPADGDDVALVDEWFDQFAEGFSEVIMDANKQSPSPK
jgi:hypothetical protein